jgi:hypothetical protein
LIVAIQTLEMKWIGVAPLLVHSGRLSDPLAQITKELKKVSSKKLKTDADFEEMSRLEFLGGLYMGEGGPIVPAENVEAVLVEGAKKTRRGVDAKAGLFVTKHADIIYDGPKDAQGLFSDGRFVSRVSAKVKQNRVMRTRPIFREWAICVCVEIEDGLLNKTDVIDFARKSGDIVGLGDWRPKYGRFTVEV